VVDDVSRARMRICDEHGLVLDRWHVQDGVIEGA